MQEKVKNIDQHQIIDTSSLLVAMVLHAQNGEATEIIFPGRTEIYPVVAHSAEASFISDNDHVLVLLTPTGAIITHRLRQPGEQPQRGFNIRKDGTLELDNSEGIVIKANDAHISIDKTGRIFVDGKEIYSFAIGVNRLQGATIELN